MNEFELFLLVPALKNGFEVVEFGHDDSYCEDVYGRIVASFGGELFRRPVPPCRSVLRERRRAVQLLHRPEITDFHLLVRNQDVLRLQVAVEVAVFVHVTYSFQHLEYYLENQHLGQNFVLLFYLAVKLVQILLYILKHQMHLLIFYKYLLLFIFTSFS